MTSDTRYSTGRPIIDVYCQRNYTSIIDEPSFIWDDVKARGNVRKHGVSFEEAVLAFRDDDGIRVFDTEHSAHEDRYLLIGLGGKGRLVVVSH